MSTQVWLALRYAMTPEVLGVFSEESKAVAACQQSIDVIGPVVLDESLPDERVEWAGAYYPLANNDDQQAADC